MLPNPNFFNGYSYQNNLNNTIPDVINKPSDYSEKDSACSNTDDDG